MGAGAVLGGLTRHSAADRRPGCWPASALVFGATILAVAAAPSRAWAVVLLVPMGAASISFVATNNATLQLRAEPEHARSGDVAQRDRFPREHADRRTLPRAT